MIAGTLEVNIQVNRINMPAKREQHLLQQLLLFSRFVIYSQLVVWGLL